MKNFTFLKISAQHIPFNLGLFSGPPWNWVKKLIFWQKFRKLGNFESESHQPWLSMTYKIFNCCLFFSFPGAFLIVYFIAMTFCGIPIFFQEVAIGQYLGSGGMTLVAQLCPLFKGKRKFCFHRGNPLMIQWSQRILAPLLHKQYWNEVTLNGNRE